MKSFTIKVALVSLLVLTFCKKKSNDTQNNSTPSTPPPVTMDGVIYTNIEKDQTNTITFCNAGANFYESTNTSLSIDPDSVMVDGILINNYMGTFKKYKEWIIGPFPFNCGSTPLWQTTGSVKISPIVHSTSNSATPYLDPSYINVSSITISSGFSLSHPVINASTITYIVSNNSGPGYKTKTVQGSSSGIAFTSSELSGFPATTNGKIEIRAVNQETISPSANYKVTFSNSCLQRMSGIIIN